MYAIIETGSKQYRVKEGDIIDIELTKQEKGSIDFDKVIFFNDGKDVIVGCPHVKNCLVPGEILNPTKGKKVIAFKYRKRKDSKKTIGHRQKYLKVKITKINLS